MPRSLRRVELASRSGDVSVEGLESPLKLSLTNGDVRLEDLRGAVDADLTNGDVEVVYRDAGRAGPHEISTVNGAVSVRLAEGVGADLKASVVNGKIEVEDGLGFEAQKKQPGWAVDARLGEGGERLTVKSVNGQIRFER